MRRHFAQNLLWHGSRMILPEHRAGTLETAWVEANQAPIPCPGQEEFELIQACILDALAEKKNLQLTLLKDEKVITIQGILMAVGNPPGYVRLLQPDGRIRSIPIPHIVGSEVL